jgi:hypothetical protein
VVPRSTIAPNWTNQQEAWRQRLLGHRTQSATADTTDDRSDTAEQHRLRAADGRDTGAGGAPAIRPAGRVSSPSFSCTLLLHRVTAPVPDESE